MLVAGVFLYAASGKMFIRYSTHQNVEPAMVSTNIEAAAPQQTSGSTDRRMVDMTADDSYLIEKGDSTIFILVGHFAAHHNGAVILADSAVRYSNQSFECFGNVLINQNSTYIYGERAEYNRNNNTAKIFSKLVKVVDEDAVMYTYDCEFNTAKSLGAFSGGCYAQKGENQLEADRGFYNTKTHELKAIDRVQMQDSTYKVISDSVIFNTHTEDAQYITNTHIWNDKDEYLYADAGTYTKLSDLHHLTKKAYILSPEREIWSDSVMYYRTEGHIIARRNIQVDDTTQKMLGFADYAEWWDEPGNAFFTRRPSMINYDPELTDSIYLSADTLWLYTIAVLPEAEKQDSTEQSSERVAEEGNMSNSRNANVEQTRDTMAMDEDRDTTATESVLLNETPEEAEADNASARGRKSAERGDKGSRREERGDRAAERSDKGSRGSENEQKNIDAQRPRDGQRVDPTANSRPMPHRDSSKLRDTLAQGERALVDTTYRDNAALDSAATDSTRVDTIIYTAKQLRRRAKAAARAERDSIKAVQRTIKDSINAIEQARLDSIQAIKDSILRIKIDTLIAERIARRSRLADEEKERIERVKQKAEKRRRHKIDKAKARALKRGKEYKGEDYTLEDTTASDSLLATLADSLSAGIGQDSLSIDSLSVDSLSVDSLAMDSLERRSTIPADSVYKKIKAYRRVKMFRTESQMICDSLVTLNTDSIIRMYLNPVMWNEANQIKSDSAWVHTQRQKITKAHFMGDPIMGSQIDTACYNQVKGKDMTAFFDNGQVYRYDVDGNAQTLYYMQEEDTPDVTAMMYIESSAISFYLNEGQMEQIVFKQNPEYVLYPMNLIPDTQERILQGFVWNDTLRPTREQICDRAIRDSRRESVANIRKPTFPITERIDYDRRRLVENRMWKDRHDRLTPEIVEWRNSCPSYKNRRK